MERANLIRRRKPFRRPPRRSGKPLNQLPTLSTQAGSRVRLLTAWHAGPEKRRFTQSPWRSWSACWPAGAAVDALASSTQPSTSRATALVPPLRNVRLRRRSCGAKRVLDASTSTSHDEHAVVVRLHIVAGFGSGQIGEDNVRDVADRLNAWATPRSPRTRSYCNARPASIDIDQ